MLFLSALCACPSMCAHLCAHPCVETLTDCTRASPLFFLCLCCFVPTLCVPAHSHLCLLISFISDLFFWVGGSLVNMPIYTCAASFPRVNSQVLPSVSAFATRQRREKNRTGRSGRGGRGGRWQVDYGRRSRCLETAGTRDARLLGDQHDAMTSAV